VQLEHLQKRNVVYPITGEQGQSPAFPSRVLSIDKLAAFDPIDKKHRQIDAHDISLAWKRYGECSGVSIRFIRIRRNHEICERLRGIFVNGIKFSDNNRHVQLYRIYIWHGSLEYVQKLLV